MLCGWEGNRRHGITLVMRHTGCTAELSMDELGQPAGWVGSKFSAVWWVGSWVSDGRLLELIFYCDLFGQSITLVVATRPVYSSNKILG